MTTDPKPLELKPCAHCGAIPNRFKERSEFWRIVCDSCGIRTEAVYPVTVAEKAWNRRHVDRELVEQRERAAFREGALAYIHHWQDSEEKTECFDDDKAFADYQKEKSR